MRKKIPVSLVHPCHNVYAIAERKASIVKSPHNSYYAHRTPLAVEFREIQAADYA